MTTDRNSMLESIAEAVADGLPVDWDGLHAEHADLAEDLKLLRMFQEVMRAHGIVWAENR